MRVRKIHFNHDHESATSDAINLLHNGRAELSKPSGTHCPKRRLCQERDRPPVTIRSCSATDRPMSRSRSARSRALPDRTLMSLPEPGSDTIPGREARWAACCHDIRSKTGSSSPILFDVKGRTDKAAVGKYVYAWTWPCGRLRRPTGGPRQTAHVVRPSAIPNPPWTGPATRTVGRFHGIRRSQGLPVRRRVVDGGLIAAITRDL
jgi:hypothetical protein